MKTLRILVLATLTATATTSLDIAAADSGKREVLARKVLDLWHIENKAISVAQRPGAEVLMQSRAALQGRVTAEKQAEVMQVITGEVQQYIDTATPVVRAQAERLKSPVLLPLLVENFSDEELAELLRILESPVKQKFEELAVEFESTYGEQVAEACREQVNAQLVELSETVAKQLRSAVMTQ